MCSIYFGTFLKVPACQLATAGVEGWGTASSSAGVAVVGGGGGPGSWQVSGGRKEAKERSWSCEGGLGGGLTFPRGIFLRVVSLCHPLLPPFAPHCSHCCPKKSKLPHVSHHTFESEAS